MAASRQMRMQNLIEELGELLGDSKAAEAVSAKLFGMEAHELEGLRDSLEVLLQAAVDKPTARAEEIIGSPIAFQPAFTTDPIPEATGQY
jgi:hypothetical protein